MLKKRLIVVSQNSNRKIAMKILVTCLIIILGSLQYRIWLGDGSYLDRGRLEHTILELEETNEKMSMENDVLMSEVIAIREGGEPLEAIARRELGMIKEGETLVLVIDDN